MVANRTRKMRPSGMTRGAYGDVNYGQGYTGTESGNAETAKPWPKVARAVSLSRHGISYTRSALIKLLKRVGMEYRKPKVMPSKLDPAKQQEFYRSL